MEDNKVEYLLLSFIKDSSCMQDGRKIMEELKSQSGISSNSSLEAIACYKYDLLIRFSRVTHQIGAAQLPESNALHASVLAAGTFTEMLHKYFDGIAPVLSGFTEKLYVV